MKASWEVKELGDLLEIQNGFAFNSKQFNAETGVPLIRIRDLKQGKETAVRYQGEFKEDYLCQSGDFLIGMDGEFACHEWKGGPALLNQRVCRLEAFSEDLFPRFLFYGINKYLKEIEEVTGFTTVKHLSSKKIKEIAFPLPPIKEQKRIVAVLDAAFEGLTRARDNAEANIQNAQELFDSMVSAKLTDHTGSWETHRLADCFRLKSGDNLTAKKMVPGPYQVYGGNGVAGTHDRHNLEGGNVIVGRVGALCGNARLIDQSIWLTDNAFKVVDHRFPFDNRFLTYLLNFKKLRSLARQAAQPVISNSSLSELSLSFPASVEAQSGIAETLARAENELVRARAKYELKLQDIDDLRQSLLQRAFSGELT